MTGRVVDRADGAPVIGATLYVPRLKEGVATDEAGRYQMTLPTGGHLLEVQSVGYAPLTLPVEVYGDGELPLELASQSTNLQEVIVEAQAPDDNVARVISGLTRLSVASIEKVLGFFYADEADTVRRRIELPLELVPAPECPPTASPAESQDLALECLNCLLWPRSSLQRPDYW